MRVTSLTLVAFVLSGFLAGCKEDIPENCRGKDDRCPDGFVCNEQTLRCEASGQDAGGVDAPVGPDAQADASFDAPVDSVPAGCASNAQCTAGKPICNQARECVECTKEEHCAAVADRTHCDVNAQECVACVSSDQCGPGKPLCHPTSRTCVGCTNDEPCKNRAATPVCDQGPMMCVECNVSADCKTTAKPVCDQHACRPCRVDSECGGEVGVCALDGHCATPDEVIWVKNRNECSDTVRGDGSKTTPFCFTQDAMKAIKPSNKRIVILQGPASAPLSRFELDYADAPVLIVGRGGARLGPDLVGSPPLISVAGANVTIRDLEISDGRGNGVVVQGGSVRMERCRVIGNAGTGIEVKGGASYDITNTIVANNGGTTDPGVKLGPTSGTKRVAYDTIVGNGLFGVTCGESLTVKGVLFWNNGQGAGSSNCVIDGTSKLTDPKFAPASYKLTAESPCRDAAEAQSDVSPFDFEGERRPKGDKWDCGADEL